MKTIATGLLLAVAAGPAAAADPGAPGDPVRWGLVLSGGGARGLAHVGVLRALEEQHLRPDIVVGTSMGAIIGSLYACGYSSAEIARVIRSVDWAQLFFPRTDAFAWRGNVAPRPLLQLGVGRSGLMLPSAPLNDAELNYLLSSLLIDGTAASGSFDGLPIRFRAVATDAATTSRVVLERGPLARAVRASMGIPLLFAPVRDGQRLLVDGGLADNLPISVAREAGAGRVVAVDVAAELKGLDSLANAPSVAIYLVRLLLQRKPGGTPSAADLLIRLPMSGYSSADYTARDSLAALGYRGSAAAIRAWADSVGLPRVPAPAGTRLVPLPPLAGHIEWVGLRSYSPAAARAALGRLPQGPFRPEGLRPALTRLFRSSLFESAWPSLDPHGDSTALRFDVREQLRRELALAAAYGRDDGERFYARLALRAPLMPPIALFEVAGIHRRYGRAVHANLEPHALGRGGSGPFLRAGYRETETRLFAGGRLSGLPLTLRREAFVGAQFDLPTRQVAQLAFGVTSISEARGRWNAGIVMFRAEGPGAVRRLFEAEWMPGERGYSRLSVLLEAAWGLRGFMVRPSLRAAGVDGEVPMDALVGLGGPLSLAGLHHQEWLGRRLAAGELRLLHSLGSALTVSAAGQLGTVEEAVSARDIGPRLQPGAGLGAELTTPFGPVRLDWGVGHRGRTRVDVMLGDRF